MNKPKTALTRAVRTRVGTRLLSLILCVVLIGVCLVVPASSSDVLPEPAESTPAPEVSPEPEASTEPDDSTEPDPSAEPGGSTEPDPSTEPNGSTEPDPSTEPDGSTEPEPSTEPDGSTEPEELVTLRFIIREGEEISLQVVKGGHIDPENIPVPEDKVLSFAGWLSPDGEPVDLTEAEFFEDMVFTAKWVRSVSKLLDTDSHKAYIDGYDSGMFRPENFVTRAEAATLFYNLLRDKAYESPAEFSDMKPDVWYADAASRMAELSIISGYDDGTFRQGKNITRAEFVKMAASFDEPSPGDCPFNDVEEEHWAAEYISSAYQKGWIAGDASGRFNPDKSITRAQAVKILNCMLGRNPNEELIRAEKNVRTFYDVYPSSWAYPYITEAATTHSYERDEEGLEYWTGHTMYEAPKKRGWLKDGGKTYYIGPDGKCVRGELTIDGKSYMFDSTGAAATGFFMKSGYKRYYKDGLMLEDISELGVVKGPYYIKVYKPANYLIIFAKGDDGKYNIPIRSMLVSCGEPTPTGTYYTPGKYRWLQMVGDSWAQWCTQILDSYLFHSVPNNYRNNYTMWVGEYNLLGTTRSLGCIRLNCRDAKWIYDNCELGTQVYISPTETSGPMAKPEGLKLPWGHNWDPTDPTAYWMCERDGCH